MTFKIFILLWKDLLYRRHKPIRTALEILIPIALMIFINVQVQVINREEPNNDYMQFVPGVCKSEINHLHVVLYEPNVPFARQLMEDVACKAGYKNSNVRPGVINKNETFNLGVKFEGNSSEFLNYTIYPTEHRWCDGHNLWRSSSDLFSDNLPKYSNPSISPVLELQYAIESSFLNSKNIKTKEVEIENMDLFSKQPRLDGSFFVILLILMYAFSNVVVTSSVVEEKVSGAKELLLMMGVQRWQIWLAKLIDALLPLLIIITVVITLLHVSLAGRPIIFDHVSACNTTLVFALGTISIVVFLFFLSCIFNSVLASTIFTFLLWVIILLFKGIIELSTNRFFAFVKCLVPHICLLESVLRLSDFEFYEKKVQYQERLSNKDGMLTLLELLLMMVFDVFLYSVITWYLDHVRPGKFGIPQPYFFCFSTSYWCPNKIDVSRSSSSILKQSSLCEEVPQGLREGISVQGLCKTYKPFRKDPVTAVNNVSIDFYKGEITGLLGHNGAGKTTMISIICGLASATSGRVLVNDYDVGKNTDEARKSLGLCPQHDMLFMNLTALENIAFFGMLKGLSNDQAFKQAKEILNRFKMENVKSNRAANLSGGQKRKVSLAIALIGDSEVIILDEPTSGMDPEIRREIWEILLLLRGTKTVILTTHFMEEADAVCDRIAIMDQGIIKCFGTPMFLKSKFGTGYTLSVVISDLGKTNDVSELVKRIIPSSNFKSQNALTLFYQLPEMEMNNFPGLFEALEEKKISGDVVSYSVTISTLEDVFLNVSFDHTKKENGTDAVDTPYKRFRSTDELHSSKYSTRILLFCQIYALLVKKFIYFKRKFLLFLILNIIFIGFIVLDVYVIPEAFKVFKSNKFLSEESLPFSLDIYGKSEVLYSSDSKNKLTDAFRNIVTDYGSTPKLVNNVTKAILDVFQEDFHKYATSTMAVEFSQNKISILHNSDAVHMVPIALNLVHNSLLKSQANGNITASLNVQYVREERDFEIVQSLTCSLLGLSMWPTFIAFFYLIPPLKEEFFGVKHLTLMLTPTFVYWGTHLIFDLATFAVSVAVISLIYASSDESSYEMFKSCSGEIVPALILWMVALLLVYYAITTIFKSIGSASIVCIMFFLLAVVSSELSAFDDTFKYFSYLHPSVLFEANTKNICNRKEGSMILGLGIYCIVLFTYLVLKDSKILEKLVHSVLTIGCKVKYDLEFKKDEAVEVEEERVKNLIDRKQFSSKVLIVNDLKRWYLNKLTPHSAVRGVSFSVNHGECFGLLGTNGAGKTSVFNMLTGNLVPSNGEGYVSSVPLFSYFKSSRALFKIGFCPQSGGFIPVFSPGEMLTLFARLRGIRCSLVQKEVWKWLERMGLDGSENKLCRMLSGGNQRKLATAVSLIGDSPLIFLDEPTTGVDPSGRRSIWNQISNLREEGQSVVLTSHSMDECEALCTRLTIMVKGQLCCLGETTVLKETFGQGYSVLIKISISSTPHERDRLKKEMDLLFNPGCNLTDEHLTMLQYHITNKAITWKELFIRLSETKRKFKFLESYSASSTTLEQLFMYFARSK